MSKKKPTIRLKHPSYQPSTAELRKDVRIKVAANTPMEKMERLAKAILRAVNIRYEKP